MKRKFMSCILISLLVFGLTACGKSNSSNNSNNSRSSNIGNSNGNSNGNNNNNNNNSNNSGNNGNRSSSGAGGFNMDNIVAAMKSANVISGEPTNKDVSSIPGAEKGLVYNNNILLIELEKDKEMVNAIKITNENKVTLDGKDYKPYLWGRYVLVFLDGKEDSKVISVFKSV